MEPGRSTLSSSRSWWPTRSGDGADQGREKWQGETVAPRSGDGAFGNNEIPDDGEIAPRSGDGAKAVQSLSPAQKCPPQRGWSRGISQVSGVRRSFFLRFDRID